MFTMNKLNSQQQNGKKVRCVSASLTACVFALTLGSVAVLTAQTVEAAGQVIGGYAAGNQALGDGSVVVSGGKDKEPNVAEGKIVLYLQVR